MTLEQAKSLDGISYVYHSKAIYADGTPCRVKITGAVRIWKRNLERVCVPWKYGLRDSGYITEQNLIDFVLPTEAEAFFMAQYEERESKRFPFLCTGRKCPDWIDNYECTLWKPEECSQCRAVVEAVGA